MTRVVATVCRSCPAGASGLTDGLRGAVRDADLKVDIRETDCMSGCARPSTVAVRSPGKTAYLFGDLTPEDIPNLVVFLRLFAASADGNLADARPLGTLREKALARIPG